jgi:hypothetical protein
MQFSAYPFQFRLHLAESTTHLGCSGFEFANPSHRSDNLRSGPHRSQFCGLTSLVLTS